MNTKRSMTVVLIALVVIVTNTFAVLAHPIEQPYVTPLPQNQSSSCKDVATQISQIDTPMRKADYDLLDRATQCSKSSAVKVRLSVLPVATPRNNRFADFKELQADQVKLQKTAAPKPAPAPVATPFADFKTQQAD